MLSYQAIQNKPHVFQSLTGLKVKEFEQLLPPIQQAWIADVEEHHIQNKPRQRQYGAGRKSQLDAIEDQTAVYLGVLPPLSNPGSPGISLWHRATLGA